MLYNRLPTLLQSEVSDSEDYVKERYTFQSLSSVRSGLSTKIKEEMENRRTWEVAHALYDTDLNIIFACASVLSQSSFSVKTFQYIRSGDPKAHFDTLDISGADSSMQFHLAFKRPQDSAERSIWAGKFAQIAYILNDRSSLYAFADSPDNVHSKYLGPFLGSDRKALSEILNFPIIPKVDKGSPSNTPGYVYPVMLRSLGETCDIEHKVVLPDGQSAIYYDCANKGI